MSNVKFHENSISGSRVVPCRRTDRHMTKLIDAIRNFTDATNSWGLMGHRTSSSANVTATCFSHNTNDTAVCICHLLCF